ncbi:MAG TPA: hypothetical protein VJ770_04560 [Stellaceae bacterium]|nr:hypothetical protein [Stellaceae bacterium]
MSTQDTLELFRKALAVPDDTLAKSISTATGLVAYDLQAPAKNLYPVVTPIRNRLPRVGGGTGTATNWRQVNAIIGSGYDAMGWVPEGQRSAQMSYSTSNKSASYVTIGEEDAATYEAISAGRGFEDIQVRMTFRLLQKMMLKEEMAILAGNAGGSNGGISLGTPATPTLSASGSGATLPAATYSVIVVALTLEGYQNSSLSGGVATSQSITGADGKSYTLSGGSSNKSSNATQAVTLGQTLFASTTAIQGAVAYAWYVGIAGSETLQAITTINSAAFSTALAGSRQAATAITADNSGNATAYNGLLTTALASGSNAYVNVLATGTAGTGTPLTASGRGSVNEIDTMLETMWQNFELSPTVLYVNAQELKNITTKVLSNASGPLLRYDSPAEGGDGYTITASGTVAYYYNPFAIDGGLRIPIRIHPRVPPGTILGWAENLPIQYQSNEVPNVAEIKTRQDYYQIDWPIVTRQRQVGVYAEECLAIYAPFAMGVICNVGNG